MTCWYLISKASTTEHQLLLSAQKGRKIACVFEDFLCNLSFFLLSSLQLRFRHMLMMSQFRRKIIFVDTKHSGGWSKIRVHALLLAMLIICRVQFPPHKVAFPKKLTPIMFTSMFICKPLLHHQLIW